MQNNAAIDYLHMTVQRHEEIKGHGTLLNATFVRIVLCSYHAYMQCSRIKLFRCGVYFKLHGRLFLQLSYLPQRQLCFHGRWRSKAPQGYTFSVRGRSVSLHFENKSQWCISLANFQKWNFWQLGILKKGHAGPHSYWIVEIVIYQNLCLWILLTFYGPRKKCTHKKICKKKRSIIFIDFARVLQFHFFWLIERWISDTSCNIFLL